MLLFSLAQIYPSVLASMDSIDIETKSKCPKISTGWEVPRSNGSSAANCEAAIGYAVAALGGGAARAFAAAGPQDDRGYAQSIGVQRD